MRRPPWLTVACLAAGLWLAAAGCGKKTPPLPPESAVPAPIGDLTAELDRDGVSLRWSWPRKTEKGALLRRISEFTVERAVDPVDGFCGECPRRYQPLASLEGGPLPERPEETLLSYRDRDLQPGYHYSYRVRSTLGWRVVSAPSAPVGLVWQVVLAPPTDLAASPGEGEVALSWRPPERDSTGVPVTGPFFYEVQRSEAGQPFRTLGGQLAAPAFTDQGAKSGVAYQYRVRAARTSGGTGEYSASLTVLLVDTTPPSAPFGLSAVVSRESVRLFWEPVSAEDFGGVMIFRRRQLVTASGELELIGRVEGRVTTYVDPLPLEAAEVRHYALKSYDRAEPPNLSEFSRETQTTARTYRP